jgi:hypothetical protein
VRPPLRLIDALNTVLVYKIDENYGQETKSEQGLTFFTQWSPSLSPCDRGPALLELAVILQEAKGTGVRRGALLYYSSKH